MHKILSTCAHYKKHSVVYYRPQHFDVYLSMTNEILFQIAIIITIWEYLFSAGKYLAVMSNRAA